MHSDTNAHPDLRTATDVATGTATATVGPPGLKGLVVADTGIGDVVGDRGFFHYRGHDAVEVAARRSFEAVTALLLDGALPAPRTEAAVRAALGRSRQVDGTVLDLARRLADAGTDPLTVCRALVSAAVDPRPTLDLGSAERRAAVLAAVGAVPVLAAAAHRHRQGLPPVNGDPALSHAADWVRMVGAPGADPRAVHAVERYLCLTAEHGFNASTFTARVVTSTGADVGGAVAAAIAALSGPLHGGAPGRVLDMLDDIGDPHRTEDWARRELEAGRRIMGFGHAVYRAEDPRSRLLRATAHELGGELVARATEIEDRMLRVLRGWRPDAVIVTNVEFYAAVVLHLAGIPQEMFTPTFTVSRVVGWGAHVLEQATLARIIRPSARYVGPQPPVPVPPGP